MTPGVLVQRLGYMMMLFTETGNTKGGADGVEVGITSLVWDLLNLRCFCDIQAVIPQGSQKHGSVAQVTDLRLEIQIQEVFNMHLEQEEKSPREYQHRRDRETMWKFASWRCVWVLAELMFPTLSILASQFYISCCNILQISDYLYNLQSFSKDWCLIRLLHDLIYKGLWL